MKRVWRFLVPKLTKYFICVFLAIVINFLIPRLMPGDAITVILARLEQIGQGQGQASIELVNTYKQMFGLDKDYPTQFVLYLFQLLFPTAFLALFSPLMLLPILPSLAVNLLSTHPLTWRLEDFHYGAPLAPFVFMAAIFGIKWLSTLAARRGTWRVTIVIALSLLLFVCTGIYHYYRGFTPLARPFTWPPVILISLLNGSVVVPPYFRYPIIVSPALTFWRNRTVIWLSPGR